MDILSSTPGSGYGTASGTSMAGPHVVGLVALLWSADPALIGNVDATEQIIESTAQHVPSDACGAASGDQNNVYGFGIPNAVAAVQQALQK